MAEVDQRDTASNLLIQALQCYLMNGVSITSCISVDFLMKWSTICLTLLTQLA